MASHHPGGVSRRAVLGLGLVGALALAGCIPPASPTVGVETPAAESTLAPSPAVPPTATTAPVPTPVPSATPDPFLATLAHIAPAERTDDQTAGDADWPLAAVDPSRLQATPETRTVEQTITHVVTRGETLSSIARATGVSVDAIAQANGLSSSSVITVGQRLAIPTGRKTTVTNDYRLASTLEPHFVWPARAPITTYFNEKGSMWKGGWHSGLDIGALYGTPIIAAEAGVVLEAGWATTRGYGNYVKLDHGLGYQTIYGHMSVIRVKEGQWVNRGDRIGDVGSTGVSTGPHVHFEVRIDGNPVDPLPYLPQ